MSPRRAAALAAGLAALAAAIATAGVRAGDDAPGLTAAALRGREIYRRGTTAAGRPLRLVLSSSDLELDATAFPCANCHGIDGGGTREGGIQPPPLRARELARPARSALTGRERPALDRSSLARAITDGVDPSGTPLHPGMPRYILAPEELADLLGYLEVLGSDADLDPGLTATTIRLGCFLPADARGEAVRAALAALADDVNRRGGIYGRRLELVHADAGEGEAGAVAAAERLIDEGVFALVACLTPPEAPALSALLAAERLPCIGPLTIPPRPEVPPNRYLFHLLSSLHDQARVLIEFIAATPELPPSGWSVVTLDDPTHREARAGVLRQVEIFGGALLADVTYAAGLLDAAATVERLRAAGTRGVLAFGAGSDLVALAGAIETAGLDWPLLTVGSALGRDAFQLPAAVARRTYLTFPSAQPAAAELDWVLELARESELALDRPAQQGPALAALRILVEGAKRCDRRLGREALVDALEGLEHFRTGLVPPVSFGPNQRTGALGAFILRIEAGAFRPASGWITPREALR